MIFSAIKKEIIFLLIIITLFPQFIIYDFTNNSKINVKNEKTENEVIIQPNDNQFGFIEYSVYDDNGGDAEGIAIQNEILYVANNDQGLEIINISNPLVPKKIANYKTAGSARDVFVKGSYAYVSQSSKGVAIININNPKKPLLVKTISLTSSVRSLDLVSNLLYIISDFSGVFIYDVSNPNEPTFVSSWHYEYILTGISVLNKYVCVSSWGEGLKIIDMTFLSSPILIGSWNETNSYSMGVSTSIINEQKIALMANTDNGITIINFTNPRSPQKIAEYNDWGTMFDVLVENNIAYCSSYDLGLVLLNVTNPSNPIELSKYNTDGYTTDVSVEDNIIAIADGYEGVKIFNQTVTYNLVYLSRFLDPGSSKQIIIDDDLAFIADTDGGLEIFNISNPASLQKIGQYRQKGFSALDISIKDDLAIISAFNKGIYFINISNPYNPVKITSFYNNNYIKCTEISNNLVFAGSFNQTLMVLDISNLPSITIAGQYVFPEKYPSVNSLLLHNNLLYVGSRLGITVLNVTNIDNIDKIDEYSSDASINDFYLKNDTLFAANDYLGLQIFNISNNQINRISGLVVEGRVNKITEYNGFIFLASQSAGLNVINFSDIENPFSIGRYSKKSSYDIKVFGYYLINAAEVNGLIVLLLDSDGDLISDIDEVNNYGTNPLDEDTDQDGMPDGFEINNLLNPLNPLDAIEDPDNDGLTNYEEWLQKYFYLDSTDPHNSDSDFDGIPDGYEVEYELNPLLSNSEYDYDFDYLTNLEEYLLGTNPKDEDTDDDGSLDGLEVLYNTDPFNPKDNPEKRKLIRIIITMIFVLILIILSIISIIKIIKKRIKKNIEREKKILEAEEDLLLF